MRTYFRIIMALVLLFAIRGADAQNICEDRPESTATLHANRLRLQFIRHGGITNEVYGPNGTHPTLVHDFQGETEPISAGIFASSFWVSAIVENESSPRIAASFFHQPGSDFAFLAGPLDEDGNLIEENCGNWDRIWSVRQHQISEHKNDLADGVLDTPIEAIMGWPAEGNTHFESIYGFALPEGSLAPFYDADQNGIYSPEGGDYPHPNGVNPEFTVGQIVWCVSNDRRAAYFHETPGLEYHFTYWAPGCTKNSGVLEESVFINTRIVNRSNRTLDSLLTGYWNDLDLGWWTDDCFGTDTSRSSVYVYNCYPNDGYNSGSSAFFGENPPVLARTYLSHPLHANMGFIQGGLCDPPLSLFEPFLTEEYVHIMNGRWRDGQPLTTGGNGYNPDNPPTRFIFHGDPNNPDEWSMLSSIPFCQMDWRSTSTIHLGSLGPNEYKEFDMALSFHRDPEKTNLENVVYMQTRVDDLKEVYQNGFNENCSSQVCKDDCVWPGDLNTDGVVNHCDLLPLGVGWEESGPIRVGPLSWAPHDAIDWGQSLGGQFDFKHIDGNGNGQLDSLDLQLISHHFGYTRPDWVPNDWYTLGNELTYQVLPPSIDPLNISPGQNVFFRTQLESVDDVFGLAFELDFDPDYWDLTSAVSPADQNPSLVIQGFTDSSAWFAFVLTDPMQTLMPDLMTIHFIRSRELQPGMSDSTWVNLKNIKGIKTDGSEIELGSQPMLFVFANPTTPIHEPEKEIHMPGCFS